MAAGSLGTLIYAGPQSHLHRGRWNFIRKLGLTPSLPIPQNCAGVALSLSAVASHAAPGPLCNLNLLKAQDTRKNILVSLHPPVFKTANSGAVGDGFSTDYWEDWAGGRREPL
ncbi:hypothetical protein NDU88_003986 [Pleurodeles waltl]|uniref:Uncharacterized protein n=1 Tax=Pleurodeles waltl TaxID=8319 RepID=A0AAV7TQ02_PLEWA|nr:hypothetical protein NDU88_003986 [Pleurodeles waltl]